MDLPEDVAGADAWIAASGALAKGTLRAAWSGGAFVAIPDPRLAVGDALRLDLRLSTGRRLFDARVRQVLVPPAESGYVLEIASAPDEPAVAARAAGAATSMRSRPRRRDRVLLIDDDRLQAPILRAIVEPLGRSLIHSRDAVEARQAFAEHERELFAVFVDSVLPKEDGTSVIRWLRSRGYSGPVFAISGVFSDARARSKALAAGADEHFEKPLSPDVVRALLRDRRAA